ncbi:MAG: aminoglycoside phosphotransferase family protein, partial [Treponema sp.]|nr:aminoglycoside phosphotransferase family protein [Treponema sp.]
SPLVTFIFEKEGLPFSEMKLLTPGTNAVFKVGANVVKIFAPIESGMDQTLDLQTELFAIRRVGKLGVSVPKLIAQGAVEDKYRFSYIITEYIKGVAFSEKVRTMTDAEKTKFGRKLRVLTDRMNTPCEAFNNIDVINDKDRSRRWDKYTEKFREERIGYIRSRGFGEKVFVHGDLCGDNILFSPDGGLSIIDFADAVLAPKIYEQSFAAVELFDFDRAFLRGYFENCPPEELIELCFDGLLIHDFGGDIVDNHIGRSCEIDSLGKLKEMLRQKIQKIT